MLPVSWVCRPRRYLIKHRTLAPPRHIAFLTAVVRWSEWAEELWDGCLRKLETIGNCLGKTRHFRHRPERCCLLPVFTHPSQSNQAPLMTKRRTGGLRDGWVVADVFAHWLCNVLSGRRYQATWGSLYVYVNVNLFRCGFAYLITLSLSLSL